MLRGIDTAWFVRCRFARQAAVWAVVCFVGGFAVRSAGASADAGKPSRHLIVLIDASGSVMGSRAVRAAYEDVLGSLLPGWLFESGFGAVPAYRPETDRVSVLHFGVVPQRLREPYRHLSRYVLEEALVQPMLVRAQPAVAEELVPHLMPGQFFQLTLLESVREAAVWRLRSGPGGPSADRTYVVWIHDGAPNEYTLSGEREMVSRSAAARAEAFYGIVDAVRRRVRFTDGAGATGWVWQHEVERAGRPRVYVEVYEVVSAAEQAWLLGTPSQPLEGVSFIWGDHRGTRGRVTAAWTEAARGWLGGADSVAVRGWVASGGSGVGERPAVAPAALGDGVAASASFVPSRECMPRVAEFVVDVDAVFADTLLGQRTRQARFARAFTTPVPPACTRRSFLIRLGVGLLVGGVLAAVGFVVFMRARPATDLRVVLPGHPGPIPLQRRRGAARGAAATAVVAADPAWPVLWVRMPGLWKQRLFYSGARLEVEAHPDAAEAVWKGSGATTVRLPVARSYLRVVWETPPVEEAKVILTLRQGSRRDRIEVSFGSVSKGGDGELGGES